MDPKLPFLVQNIDGQQHSIVVGNTFNGVAHIHIHSDNGDRGREAGDSAGPSSADNVLDTEVEDMLAKLNLISLRARFEEEELTLPSLAKLTSDNLKEIGVEKIKDRKAIMEEVKRRMEKKTAEAVIQKYEIKTILISTTGKAAEYVGAVLGVYNLAGEWNGCPYYKQQHTVKTRWRRFVYRVENGDWYVGPNLGKRCGGLWNAIDSATTVPITGWQYAGERGGWSHDPNLTVTPISDLTSVTCSSITITATEEAATRTSPAVWAPSPPPETSPAGARCSDMSPMSSISGYLLARSTGLSMLV